MLLTWSKTENHFSFRWSSGIFYSFQNKLKKSLQNIFNGCWEPQFICIHLILTLFCWDNTIHNLTAFISDDSFLANGKQFHHHLYLLNLFILHKWRPCCQKHLFCLVLDVFMQIFILCRQKSKVYLCVFVHISVHLGCLTGGINDIWNCLVTNLLYKNTIIILISLKRNTLLFSEITIQTFQSNLGAFLYMVFSQIELMHLSGRWAI